MGGCDSAVPSASVVVPAHDEAGVVERCLTALLSDARPGELDVVVVANGCSDDTAARARAFAQRSGRALTVLELPAAGKAAALRAGDGAARTFPRIYLDADAVCSTDVVRQLARALQAPGVELAVPRRELHLSAIGPGARLYYRTWQRLPRVQDMLAGRGCYALSGPGHERLGSFPDHVADDRLVTTAVPRTAARTVSGSVTVHPPPTLRRVLQARTRVYAGNAQLGTVAHPEPPAALPRWLAVLCRPSGWPGLVLYAGVTALAKARARAALRSGAVAWRGELRGLVPLPAGSAGAPHTPEGCR